MYEHHESSLAGVVEVAVDRGPSAATRVLSLFVIVATHFDFSKLMPATTCAACLNSKQAAAMIMPLNFNTWAGGNIVVVVASIARADFDDRDAS